MTTLPLPTLPSLPLPDLSTLIARLSAALEGNASLPGPLTVLERKLPYRTSTFPNETVLCRFGNGREQRIFVKYEAGQSHESYGHRGGVSYEADVYRHLLNHYPGFSPKCLGTHTDSQTGETWLVLEYLENCVPVIEIPVKDPTRPPISMTESARWIARFHAAHEESAANGAPAFLKRYDAEYYRGWCRRTAELTQPIYDVHPWLPDLCKKEVEWFTILSEASRTIIHGEYYGKTLMFRQGTPSGDNAQVFPVDWESTALGVGEIDLAALTEGIHWPARVVEQCERIYQQTRWPQGAPSHFAQTLAAARIYLHFRWLGERPDWTFRKKTLWRYDHLKAAAERLGLI
jgi:hypothetical protein